MFGQNRQFQDTQQVCLKGHQITAHYHMLPNQRRDFCERCGARTIHTCPSCGSEIQGKVFIRGVIVSVPEPVPEFCDECGRPLPWKKGTIRRIFSSLANAWAKSSKLLANTRWSRGTRNNAGHR